MSLDPHSPSITLVVTNPGRLMHGCKASHRFGSDGGTLGSQAGWRLFDREQRINPLHCEICWHEGSFCIIDHCGETYMNGSDLSLTPGHRVRLKADDSLQVGDYLITAYLDAGATAGDRHVSQYSMTELLNDNACPLEVLSQPFDQPLQPLLESPACYDELDPLVSLNNATQALADPVCADLFDITVTGYAIPPRLQEAP